MSINSLPGFLGMCGTFTALTVIAVALRFYVRKNKKMPLLADDWLMLTAVAFFLGEMIVIFLLARDGFVGYGTAAGLIKSTGKPATQAQLAYGQEVVEVFYMLAAWTLGMPKISVLFFYLRVFCPNRKQNPIRHALVTITIVVVACWIVAFFFLALFTCHTNFAFGTPSHFKHCSLLEPYQLGMYISDIALDVWIMALPIPYINQLQMSRFKKWLTSVIFVLSFVGLAASIARLVNHLEDPPTDTSNKKNGSGLSAFTGYFFFTTLEMGITIIAINLPILYSLFSQTFPETLLKISRSVKSLTSRSGSDLSNSDSSRRGSVKNEETKARVQPSSSPNTTISAGADRDRQYLPEISSDHEICVQAMIVVESEEKHGEV